MSLDKARQKVLLTNQKMMQMQQCQDREEEVCSGSGNCTVCTSCPTGIVLTVTWYIFVTHPSEHVQVRTRKLAIYARRPKSVIKTHHISMLILICNGCMLNSFCCTCCPSKKGA